MLDHNIRDPFSLPYHLCFIVELTYGGLLTWYQSQEVSSSSPGHAYSPTYNYSHLKKSIRYGSRSISKWGQSFVWHAIRGMLEPNKRPLAPLISPKFYSQIGRGVLQHDIRGRRSRVQVLGTHIPLCVIISAYRSP
jgi:hypothetical protein